MICTVTTAGCAKMVGSCCVAIAAPLHITSIASSLQSRRFLKGTGSALGVRSVVEALAQLIIQKSHIKVLGLYEFVRDFGWAYEWGLHPWGGGGGGLSSDIKMLLNEQILYLKLIPVCCEI